MSALSGFHHPTGELVVGYEIVAVGVAILELTAATVVELVLFFFFLEVVHSF